jgi:hypothetical protein
MRNDPPHIDKYSVSRGGTFWVALDGDQKLALLDFLLFLDRDKYNADEGRKSLEMYLRAGGSEWRVGTRAGDPGLEKRVPQGVVDAAEGVMATSATAGALLSEAWHAAYGRNPNPEEAYEKAIKAVEEAGAEVVLPKNPKATLGTMIAAVRDQGDWSLPLETASAMSAPLEMMKALWKDRRVATVETATASRRPPRLRQRCCSRSRWCSSSPLALLRGRLSKQRLAPPEILVSAPPRVAPLKTRRGLYRVTPRREEVKKWQITTSTSPRTDGLRSVKMRRELPRSTTRRPQLTMRLAATPETTAAAM